MTRLIQTLSDSPLQSMARATSIMDALRARRLWLATTTSLVWLLPGLLLAAERLSDDAFDQIRIEVQAELDARYAAVQSANELFPGATFAFGLPDGRVAKFTVGYSDVEKKLPMRSDSRMPSGSIGKTYVAAVAMGTAARADSSNDFMFGSGPSRRYVGESSRAPRGIKTEVRASI